tara:strand:- start:849 stop:1295 length:447 start_codon:yes stop_codon:yes gene_type:complete
MFVFLILSISLVSADYFERESITKDYTTDFEKITYIEDLKGKVKGFSLTISSNSPKYSYEYEDDYPYITWGRIYDGGGYRGRNRYRYSWEDRDYGRYSSRDRYYNRNYYDLEPIFNTYRLGRDRYRRNRYDYGYPYRSGYGGYRRSYW